MSDLLIYKRRLERERRARKEAEYILEKKALELFTANERLQKLYKTKDELLEAISKALIVLFKEDDFDQALTESIRIVGATLEVDRFSIATLEENEGKYRLLKNYFHANRKFESLYNLLNKHRSLDRLFYRFSQIFLKGNKLVKFNSSQNNHQLVTRTMNLIGLSSVVLMPIEYQGSIRAIISLELIDIEYDWSENDEAILLAYAAGVESVLEKFEARKKLEEQKTFYENVLNSIPSDLVVFDKNHRYKFVNPIAIQDPKIRSWLIDKDDFEYVEYRNKPKLIAENRRAIFKKVTEDKNALSFEEKFVTKEGSEEWKLRNLFPVFDKDEELEMVIGYGIDITDIKQTNLKLNTTSTRLSTLISSLNSGILLEDKNRRILITNEEFCSIFNINANPKDLVGFDCSNSGERSKHLLREPEKFVIEMDRIVKDKKIRTNEEIHFKDGRIYERDFIPIYLEKEYLGHLWEYRDITEKKKSEQELIQLSSRLSTLLNNLNTGVLMEQSDRMIVHANDKFCDLFGNAFEPSDLMGRDYVASLEQVKGYFEEPDQFVASTIKLGQENKRSVNEELELMNGRILERDYIPIIYGGVQYGTVWQYRDITDRKKSEKELLRALESERSYNELNKNFVSMVSHEFRTPLTSIFSTAELLLEFSDSYGPADIKKRVGRIHASSIRMENLIEDVLTIGKLDSTQVIENMQKFKLSEVLDDTIKMLRSMGFKDREIHVSGMEYERLMYSDLSLVELIFRNLLENACKYSESGIDFKFEFTSKQVHIECVDYGIGIPQQELNLVFEPFKRASNTEGVKGTGLGLPIVKKSVEKIGGKIWVESEQGKGSKFKVELPLAASYF